jgi:hypothetical protein
MNWINKIIEIIKSWFSKKDRFEITDVEQEVVKVKHIIVTSIDHPHEAKVLNEIIIGNGKDNVTLNRINDFKFDHNWEPLSGKHDSANFFSQIVGAGAAAGSVVYSTEGLYRATVSPDKLMNYNNGTLSSITLNGDKFGSHAGFVNANAAVFAPVLIFQLASMVTGQYYFNGMTKQLSAIQKGIDQILQSYNNERIAKIKAITDKLLEYEKSKYFTLEDFVTIDKIKMELATIRYEYLLAANQQLKQSLFPDKNISGSTITLSNVGSVEALKIKTAMLFDEIKNNLNEKYKDSGAEGVLNKIVNFMERSGNKADRLVQKVNESKFIFFLEAALEADKLYQYMLFMELKANLSYKNPDENRVGKIDQLYNALCGFDEKKDSISDEVNQAAQSLQTELSALLSHYKQNTFMNETEISQNEKVLATQFKKLEKYWGSNIQLKLERKKIQQAFISPVEFVIDNRGGKGQIYVKTNKEKANLIH